MNMKQSDSNGILRKLVSLLLFVIYEKAKSFSVRERQKLIPSQHAYVLIVEV